MQCNYICNVILPGVPPLKVHSTKLARRTAETESQETKNNIVQNEFENNISGVQGQGLCLCNDC